MAKQSLTLVLLKAPQCFCPDGPTLFHNGAAGDSTCMECGVVLSEGALVSEVTFGETSGGAAVAHGTLVAEGSSERL